MTDVWRFAPRIPFTETLSFLTDVQSAELAESRTSVRHARMVFQMRHLLGDVVNLEAEAIFDANRFGTFRVPAWGEATEFAVTVPAGATVLTVGPADWRVGGEVFMYSPGRAVAVGVIAGVAPGSITLAAPTTLPVRFAVPLRQCKPLSALTGSRVEQGLSERQVTFVTQDNTDLAAHDMPEIDGLMVIGDAFVTAGGVDQAMVHPDETVDDGPGGVVVIPLRPGVNHRLGISFLDRGAAALWRRRQFWHALRGRATEFWLPTFASDLRLAEGVGAADLTVRVAAPAWDMAALNGLVLALGDGSGRVYRKVTGVALDGGTWVIDIGGAVGRDLASTARLSVARRMRLDVDDIALTYPMQGLMRSAALCVGVP